MDTPYTFALHVASYMSDGSSIRAAVANAFGKDKAPSLEVCRNIRLRAMIQTTRKGAAEANDSDGNDYVVRSLIPRVEPPKPISPEALATPPKVSRNPFIHRVDVGDRLIESVADDFGLTYGELIGTLRFAPIVQARAVVVKLLQRRGWSTSRIGRLLGGRDHSTITNASQKFDIYCAQHAQVAKSYNRHVRLMAAADEQVAA